MILGGCATIKPEPLTNAEIKDFASADRQRSVADVEPLQNALTLEEAIARAIKYNIDRRVRIMEEAVAAGQLDVGRYDMLPKVVANAGYRERDSYLVSKSRDSVTGEPSLTNPFISTDKAATTTDLSFTWSLLDFGQSYYASKQNADRVLIAAERRRKALHLLIQDVRTAFWRVASSQKLKGEVQKTIADAEDALADSRRAQASGLRNPLDALRYQRQVLENLRLLEAIDQELSTARVELATLTNLPLVQNVTVVEPSTDPNTRWLDIPVEVMEEHALARNADLREAFYNSRIASQETRRALLRIFPGLSFSYALKNSNDSFLINQNWSETGAQLSFNLLGLLSAPAQMQLAEAGIAVADQRRMATQMAVLAQLHIARLQYGNAYRQFDRADAIARIDAGIAEHMANRERAQTMTKLDRVANQTSAILSQLRRYQALAQVHAAASKLQATLGLEPVGEGAAQLPLPELRQAIGASLKRWEDGVLASPVVDPVPAPGASRVQPVAVSPAAELGRQMAAIPPSPPAPAGGQLKSSASLPVLLSEKVLPDAVVMLADSAKPLVMAASMER